MPKRQERPPRKRRRRPPPRKRFGPPRRKTRKRVRAETLARHTLRTLSEGIKVPPPRWYLEARGVNPNWLHAGIKGCSRRQNLRVLGCRLGWIISRHCPHKHMWTSIDLRNYRSVLRRSCVVIERLNLCQKWSGHTAALPVAAASSKNLDEYLLSLEGEDIFDY